MTNPNPCASLDDIHDYRRPSRQDASTLSAVARHYVALHTRLTGQAASDRARIALSRLDDLIRARKVNNRRDVCKSLWQLVRGEPVV